jgi:hypothetical protein
MKKRDFIEKINDLIHECEDSVNEKKWDKVNVLFRVDPTTCMGQLIEISNQAKLAKANKEFYLIVFFNKKPNEWVRHRLRTLEILYICSEDPEYIAHVIKCLNQFQKVFI